MTPEGTFSILESCLALARLRADPPLVPRTTCTELERRFAEAYVGEAAGNASRAAELAGYRAKPSKAGAVALARPHVAALIAELQQRAVAAYAATPSGQAVLERTRVRAEASERHADLAERNLEELSAVGFSDITEVVRWQTVGDDLRIRFVNSQQLPERVRRSIASVTKVIRADGTIEMKLTMHPKVAALQQLVKITGQAEPERSEVNVQGDAVVVMYPHNGREAALAELDDGDQG